MGNMKSLEMSEAVNDGMINIEVALTYHLTSNHYPPVSPAFIPACLEAIEAGNFGDWDTQIELPNGRTLTAGEIVEGLHLDAFIDVDA